VWPGQGVARRARSRVRTERSRRGPNRSRHGADRTSRQRLHSHCFGERAGLDQGRTHRLARQPRPTAVVQLPCGHDCGQHVTDAAVLRAPASSPTPRGQLSAAGTPASAADRTPQRPRRSSPKRSRSPNEEPSASQRTGRQRRRQLNDGLALRTRQQRLVQALEGGQTKPRGSGTRRLLVSRVG
jgi:hypothetical protein